MYTTTTTTDSGNMLKNLTFQKLSKLSPLGEKIRIFPNFPDL